VTGLTVTGGGFRARALLVKSFKKSLDTERAVSYLAKIGSIPNHFSVPFYNDFLVEVFKGRKDLIDRFVLQDIDRLLDQTDSIKIFFSIFLESEDLCDDSATILDSVKNVKSFEFLRARGNLYSHRIQDLNIALATYKKALEATSIERYQATIYNNMAQTIYRHRKRKLYEMAIDYCERSISLRSTVKFHYPSSLLLAIRIELANRGELQDIVRQHKDKYGLDDREAKSALELVHDIPKRNLLIESLQLRA
jgi:tetratricopeptide (TPR) repeat protein